MFAAEENWREDPKITGVILFFVLISPMGAPLLFLLTSIGCDIGWDTPYQCVIPQAMFTYFFLCFVAPFAFGPWFAVPWFVFAIGLVIRFTWLFGVALHGGPGYRARN